MERKEFLKCAERQRASILQDQDTVPEDILNAVLTDGILAVEAGLCPSTWSRRPFGRCRSQHPGRST